MKTKIKRLEYHLSDIDQVVYKVQSMELVCMIPYKGLIKGNVYHGLSSYKVKDWSEYCVFNEDVWISELKEWVSVKCLIDIQKLRNDKLSQLGL